MNKILKLKSILFLAAISVFTLSCESDSNDDLLIDPTNPSEFDGELSVFEDGNDNRTVTINSANTTDDLAKVKVSFASSNSMKRLYVTQNVSGYGDEPFQFEISGVTVDDKKDGSLDLSSDNGDAFDFQINFPVPSSDDSNIVYTLWATTGKGDFRDISKRNAISDTAIGTITISGSGSNSGNGIKSFEGIKLYAPTGDGQSMTFFSLYTGEVYKINPYDDASLNSELVEIWDFGYYYTPVGDEDATLASVQGYELPGVDISAISGIATADFNQAYFKSSTLVTADFDSATLSDLSTLSVSAADSEKLNAIASGDIIEFQDKYGNKGLIKVTQVYLGESGNGYDADAYITLDIKVQI